MDIIINDDNVSADKPEQPSAENTAVPAEKSTDEQTEGASPRIITSNALAEAGDRTSPSLINY